MASFAYRVKASALLLIWLTTCGGCGTGSRSAAQPDVRAPNQADRAPDAVLAADRGRAADAIGTDGSSRTGNSRSTASIPDALPTESVTPAFDKRGDWTRYRLFPLAKTGPLLLDMAFQIGAQDLSSANRDTLAEMSHEILADLEPPATWEYILDHPLVRSGWLGNLATELDSANEATTENADMRRRQLIAMYDTQRDNLVDETELSAFLSRGLSRISPVLISDIGTQPGTDFSRSPWGKADANQDFSLDVNEVSELKKNVSLYDANSDGIVTLREVSSTGGPAMQSTTMNQRGRLPTSSLISLPLVAAHTTHTEDTDKAEKLARQSVADLLRHYTYLAELPRQVWPAWSDAAWSRVDSDANGALGLSEARQLVELPAHLKLWIRLPSPSALVATATPEWNVEIAAHEDFTWHDASATSAHTANLGASPAELQGKLVGQGRIVKFQVRDALSADGARGLRRGLEQALKNPQIRAAFATQLQLQDSAFDLLDSDQDQSLSDAEWQRAWRWLTLQRGSRITARWMLADHAWFLLADLDDDGRLTQPELTRLGQRLAELDDDGDRLITPSELPLVALLEISRDDPRLSVAERFTGGDSSSKAEEHTWFSAMDSNRDSLLSQSEFLGGAALFERLDSDSDGYLSSLEAMPQAEESPGSSTDP